VHRRFAGHLRSLGVRQQPARSVLGPPRPRALPAMGAEPHLLLHRSSTTHLDSAMIAHIATKATRLCSFISRVVWPDRAHAFLRASSRGARHPSVACSAAGRRDSGVTPRWDDRASLDQASWGAARSRETSSDVRDCSLTADTSSSTSRSIRSCRARARGSGTIRRPRTSPSPGRPSGPSCPSTSSPRQDRPCRR
jgi:hypothetical protein